MLERRLVIVRAVAHLAVQHLRGDGEDVEAGVVEHGAGGRHPGHRGLEARPLGPRRGHVLQHRVREPPGVVQHRGRRAVEDRILRQRHGEDFAPFAEADGRVHLHRHVSFQPVGHRRALHAEHRFGDGLQQALRRVHRGPVVAEEHRPVEHEVVVVGEGEREPGSGGLALEELPVGGDGAGVPLHRRVVVPALDVDVGGHVPQVAGVGHEVAQAVGRAQCALRMRGHLQHVQVHVQQAGVVRPARRFQGADGVFERRERFQGVRALGRIARREVPQGPGRAVHERLGEQCAYVRVARERAVHLAHRIGVAVVPPVEVAVRLRRGVAPRQRLDERPLHRARVPDALQRLPDGGADLAQGGRELGRIELAPRLVVVGTGGVADPPPGHRAAGVVPDRPPEAAHRLLVAECVAPHQPPVEPALRLGRAGGDRAGEGPEIVAVVVVGARHLVCLGAGWW